MPFFPRFLAVTKSNKFKSPESYNTVSWHKTNFQTTYLNFFTLEASPCNKKKTMPRIIECHITVTSKVRECPTNLLKNFENRVEVHNIFKKKHVKMWPDINLKYAMNFPLRFLRFSLKY